MSGETVLRLNADEREVLAFLAFTEGDPLKHIEGMTSQRAYEALKTLRAKMIGNTEANALCACDCSACFHCFEVDKYAIREAKHALETPEERSARTGEPITEPSAPSA